MCLAEPPSSPPPSDPLPSPSPPSNTSLDGPVLELRTDVWRDGEGRQPGWPHQ